MQILQENCIALRSSYSDHPGTTGTGAATEGELEAASSQLKSDLGMKIDARNYTFVCWDFVQNFQDSKFLVASDTGIPIECKKLLTFLSIHGTEGKTRIWPSILN